MTRWLLLLWIIFANQMAGDDVLKYGNIARWLFLIGCVVSGLLWALATNAKR